MTFDEELVQVKAQLLSLAERVQRLENGVGQPADEARALADRAARHKAGIALLDEWRNEDPTYDERMGALLERELGGGAS